MFIYANSSLLYNFVKIRKRGPGCPEYMIWYPAHSNCSWKWRISLTQRLSCIGNDFHLHFGRQTKMCCLLFRSFWLTCAEGGDNALHACRIESTWSVGLLYQRKRVYSSSSASDCLFIRVNIQFTCICRHFIRVSDYTVVLPVSGKTPNCHHGAPSIRCHWLGPSCPG